METWAAKVKGQLIEAGFSFYKDSNGDWDLMEGEKSLLPHRQQGELIKQAAKEIGL